MEAKINIIPAILEKHFSDIKKRIRLVETLSRHAQIDVADGKFVSGKTFLDLKKFQTLKTKLNFEIHLMVENPKKFFLCFSPIKKYIELLSTENLFPASVICLQRLHSFIARNVKFFLR